MPKNKSKKRKLVHPKPYNDTRPNQSELTHQEIWDDSALLRSWDEAVAEYEFYHSIHARGEDVDEVLKQYHAASHGNGDGSAEEGEVSNDDDDADDYDDEEGEILEDTKALDPAGDTTEPRQNLATSNERPTKDAQPQEIQSKLANIDTSKIPPQNILPDASTTPQLDTQTQTLENIKMAYYWAGYYSGLYDSQQQAAQQATHGPHTSTPQEPSNDQHNSLPSITLDTENPMNGDDGTV